MSASKLSTRFGIVIRRRRLALKLSQERFAERAGLHPTYISMVERGVRNPTLDVASSIAKALRVDVDELIRQAENLKTQKGRRS